MFESQLTRCVPIDLSVYELCTDKEKGVHKFCPSEKKDILSCVSKTFTNNFKTTFFIGTNKCIF